MDEELRDYLMAMEGRLASGFQAGITALEARTMAKMNDGFERIINRLTSLEREFLSVKGSHAEDTIANIRRWMDLDHRVTRLEDRDTLK